MDTLHGPFHIELASCLFFVDERKIICVGIKLSVKAYANLDCRWIEFTTPTAAVETSIY